MQKDNGADEKDPKFQFSFPKMEEEILDFWEKNKIFEKSVEQRKGKEQFVFFEGPPTANGTPGVHHVEARSFKDIILRYKTMRGFYTPRRAGWDTHGLPVEVEVEKKLGFKNKKEIEAYGIAKFNKKCKESVWQYKDLWDKLTARMGFWIDMEHPYITYENYYIESLWWVIKQFADKKYLYEDYKVLPWCARCGTALSSHELAQGYEKVKDDSVYVKFQVKDLLKKENNPTPSPLPLVRGEGGERDDISLGGGEVFFLAWTTTPWTLPGNVALAVNPEVDYVVAEKDREKLVLAEARVSVLGDSWKIIKKINGKEFVGLRYTPLYESEDVSKHGDKIYIVVAGDFVSTEDGTGIVHIAPAFGDDDFQLSKKYDLPVLITTGEDGLMKTLGQPLNGEWFKKADKLIIENLKTQGLLFKIERYEHDYPFCWRCRNPLMYLARKAWWVDVNAVREKMLANNETINWIPEHIKHGRFGEWLKEKKNWAFSRERYWGTPLPVWRCIAEGCGEWKVVGSLEELKLSAGKSNNRYILIRHGESENNVKNITSSNLKSDKYKLTQKGREQSEKLAEELLAKNIKPDLILSSPFLRAKETAEIIAKKFDTNVSKIKIEPRFAEINVGNFSDKPLFEYINFYKDKDKFTEAVTEGENLQDLKKRAYEVILELESKHKNKTIFIISHEDTIWMAHAVALGQTNEKTILAKKDVGGVFIKNAKYIELDPYFNSIPKDENFVLDLHKPFIDEVVLGCRCGGKMYRVPEVCDVWFDSGAMPYAQWHYPFEDKLEYPADYIVEGVDQTRGWFYNLLSVGTLLDREAPYKNVISMGHLLDKKGKKMSKSLGNIVDPTMPMDKYGADSVRWYFYTINQPGDSKLFDEADVKAASRRFFMILWNVLQFWKMYQRKDVESGEEEPTLQPPSISKGGGEKREFLSLLGEGFLNLLINKWVLAKLEEVTNSVAKNLDKYEIVTAARELENFVVEDISRWYVRRIRDVIKNDSEESKETSQVLQYVLSETAKLLAPFAPFISEKVWMELGNESSVHLEDWSRRETLVIKSAKTPSVEERDKISKSMTEVRKVVGLALEARQTAGIKVRQPLSKLFLKNNLLENKNEFLELIKDEVNIKEIIFGEDLTGEVKLDTNITPELKNEGILRDLIREIQAARKDAGLTPKDKISAKLELPKEIFEVAEKNKEILGKETNLKSSEISEAEKIKIILK